VVPAAAPAGAAGAAAASPRPAPPAPARIPTAFSGFSVTLDQYGHLGYSGCLGLAAGIPVTAPAQLSGPTIQYAAQPLGPWHTLTSATLTRVPCGHGGQEFSGRTTAPLNLAYYRAYFPGRALSSGTGSSGTGSSGTGSSGTGSSGGGYLASVSPAVLAWKFADRITAFRVSAASSGKRSGLTIRGTLQYYRYGWHGYRGQTVLAILRPKGRDAWYWIQRLTTGPGGRFSVTLADPLSATWSAEYLGNSTHFATVAAMMYVPLTTR